LGFCYGSLRRDAGDLAGASARRPVSDPPQINAGPVALEAAIRNEADLLALLPPEPSAKSRPQRAVVMSALARGADIGGAAGHVRYGPILLQKSKIEQP